MSGAPMSFDPDKWGAAVEKYLGRWFGRKLMQGAIIATLFSIMIAALVLFFEKLVDPILWPFFVRAFGGPRTGISLDNLEAIILVLVLALGLLVLLMAITVYAFVSAFRRRTVPQNVIDDVANLRSEGIQILNMLPPSAGSMTDAQKDAYISKVWHTEWTDWRRRAVAYLENHFTTAEALSFSRLGLITPTQFTFALNPRHEHYLTQLAKQLTTLENLIERHLERR
jgi:hypothetical protein